MASRQTAFRRAGIRRRTPQVECKIMARHVRGAAERKSTRFASSEARVAVTFRAEMAGALDRTWQPAPRRLFRSLEWPVGVVGEIAGRCMVDVTGLEPVTPCLQSRCSPS